MKRAEQSENRASAPHDSGHIKRKISAFTPLISRCEAKNRHSVNAISIAETEQAALSHAERTLIPSDKNSGIRSAEKRQKIAGAALNFFAANVTAGVASEASECTATTVKTA